MAAISAGRGDKIVFPLRSFQYAKTLNLIHQPDDRVQLGLNARF